MSSATEKDAWDVYGRFMGGYIDYCAGKFQNDREKVKRATEQLDRSARESKEIVANPDSRLFRYGFLMDTMRNIPAKVERLKKDGCTS
jgi:hypothetical protein